jgi:hypothetical protein
MSEMAMGKEVAEQFDRVFSKFRETVEAYPEEEWRAGDTPYQRPAGLAGHVLATIDFYTSGLPAEEFPWGKRLGADWEDPNDDVLPSKDLILDYLTEMEGRILRWTSRTDFSARETLHPYTGETLLGRAMYIIRHCESHLAELSLELRRRGLLGPEWR